MAARAMGVRTSFSTHWRKTVADKVQGAPKHEHQCTIYRVPPNLRKCDEEAYSPRVVSIGPYHRGDRRLKPIEDIKWSVVHVLTSRHPDNRIVVERCLLKLVEVEKEAYRSYMGQIEIKGDEFVEMLLLDGCFIIDYLLKEAKPEYRQREGVSIEQVSGMLGADFQTYLDLLLLENQIPFFVLEDLFVLLRTDAEANDTLVHLALKVFLKRSGRTEIDLGAPIEEIHHLLHLFHWTFIPTPPKTNNSELPCFWWKRKKSSPTTDSLPISQAEILPNITGSLTTASQIALTWVPNVAELEHAGVKIKAKNKKCKDLDITFNKRSGVLEIPCIYVNKYSNIHFRNLIAFEQCFPHIHTYVTAYVAFMDSIVFSKRDLTSLHRKGIVMNGMKSEEAAAKFFSKLSEETLYKLESFYLQNLIRDVKQYHNVNWHKWRAKLMRDYFSNPWTFISFGAAFFLLALTVIQTVFNITAYYSMFH